MDTIATLHTRTVERQGRQDGGSEAAVRTLLRALGEWGVAEERAAPSDSLQAHFLRARDAYLSLAGSSQLPRAA